MLAFEKVYAILKTNFNPADIFWYILSWFDWHDNLTNKVVVRIKRKIPIHDRLGLTALPSTEDQLTLPLLTPACHLLWSPSSNS